MRPLARIAIGGAFAAIVVGSGTARAQGKTAVAVTRAASASDCPDAPALVARTAASGAKTEFVAAGAPSTTRDEIVVAFDREGDERRASIAAPGGRTRTLVERAKDCDGLADAVVVALVLSTDGREDTAPRESPAAPAPTPTTRDEAAAEPTPAPPPTEGGLLYRASAGALASIGVVREAAPAAVLGFHLGPREHAFRAGAVVTFVPPNDLPVGEGSISVFYAATALDLCWAFVRERPIAFEGCGRGEVGLLSGEARGFATNDDRTRVRVAGGPVARAIVPLGASLGLFVEGSALAAAKRQRFAIEGAGVAYDPPAIGLGAGAGLALTIR